MNGAAASTVATLILEFKTTELIFTGVAGAINHQLRIGDIVLGKRLIQHDMDARQPTIYSNPPLAKWEDGGVFPCSTLPQIPLL